MTTAHRIPLASTLAILAALVLASPASGQDACTQAAAHVTECQTHFCPLSASSDRCSEGLQALADELSTTCDGGTAQGILLQSCAGLLGSSGAGGTICEQAVAHYLGCIDQVCSGPDQPEDCRFFDDVEAEVEAELEEMGCSPDMYPMMEAMLETPCEQILGF